MLEARHARVGHFGRANGIGHMAFECDALFFGLVGDGEDGVAWDKRLQLDKVGVAVFQIGDRTPRVVRRGNENRAWKARFGTIEHWSGGKDVWPDEATEFNFGTPTLHDLKFTAHVTNFGDTICDEEWKRNVFGSGKPIAENQMHVHVPQAGDQKESSAIDASRGAWILCKFCGTDRENTLPFKGDSLIRPHRACADVDDVDMVEDEEVVRRRLLSE